MGQGSTPSGGDGAQSGGGMGLGLLGSIFGSGTGSPSGATSPSTTPYYIENPNTGTAGQGPGIMAQLGKILQDPEVLKALGETTKHLGNTIASGNKIPGHAATMLQQAIGGQSQPGSSDPYLGDIPQFSPQQAQTILQALGIPGGFNSLALHRNPTSYS